MLCFLLDYLIFYLSHLGLQSIWNLFFCMVWGRDQGLFFPYEYTTSMTSFKKCYVFSASLQWCLYGKLSGYICESISGVSVLFHWPVCFSLQQCHTFKIISLDILLQNCLNYFQPFAFLYKFYKYLVNLQQRKSCWGFFFFLWTLRFYGNFSSTWREPTFLKY